MGEMSMKGFWKRELYLLRPNLWFCGVFLGLLLLAARFAPLTGPLDFAVLFLVLLGLNGIQSLFLCDEINAWQAYAAAVPGGRRTMVDARYLFALEEGLLLMGAILLISVLRRESLSLWSAGFYGATLLVTLAVTLPIYYRWGGTRGKLVSVLFTFTLLGVMGGLSTGVLDSAREDLAQGFLREDVKGFFSAAALVLPLLGLGALALSRRVSRRIMQKKEL